DYYCYSTDRSGIHGLF
nr:immunoglobulin light chain junction region [Macaca mulatta]MOX36989.1 immunoglobulin light chain junction region [Macaca mulatta]